MRPSTSRKQTRKEKGSYKRRRKKVPEKKIRRKDTLPEKISLLVIFIIIFSTLILTSTLTIKRGLAGEDILFHTKIAALYASGQDGMFSDLAFKVNGGPYPPLFHIMLAMLMLLGPYTSLFIVEVMQALAYPAVLAVTAFLVYKKMNLRAAAFTTIIMVASVALFDRTAQLTPQALDMILFPLALYFFMDNKKAAYVITMTAIIYNHGAWSFLLFGSVILYSLLYKKNREYNVYAFILGLPMLLITLFYLPGYMSVHDKYASYQEQYLAGNVIGYIEYTGLIVGAFILAYLIYMVVELIRKKRFPYKLSALEKMASLWLLSLIPIFITISDRFASYAMPPVAILISGMMVRRLRKRETFIPVLIGTAVIALAFTLISWSIQVKTGSFPFMLS